MTNTLHAQRGQVQKNSESDRKIRSFDKPLGGLATVGLLVLLSFPGASVATEISRAENSPEGQRLRLLCAQVERVAVCAPADTVEGSFDPRELWLDGLQIVSGEPASWSDMAQTSRNRDANTYDPGALEALARRAPQILDETLRHLALGPAASDDAEPSAEIWAVTVTPRTPQRPAAAARAFADLEGLSFYRLSGFSMVSVGRYGTVMREGIPENPMSLARIQPTEHRRKSRELPKYYDLVPWRNDLAEAHAELSWAVAREIVGPFEGIRPRGDGVVPKNVESLYECPGTGGCRLPSLAPFCDNDWSPHFQWFTLGNLPQCIVSLEGREDAWCALQGDFASCCAYSNDGSCTNGTTHCTCVGRGRAAYYQQCDGRDAHPSTELGTAYCCRQACPPDRPGDTVEPDPTAEDYGEGQTPIALDLDGQRGFDFTSPRGGVSFDLDADGHAERVAWIQPGSGDAWLALDRDGDGRVTSGAELFGGVTEQLPSDEPNGYRALAVLDSTAAGGNEDGRITADDASFGDLRLWIDKNHDGVSQPAELFSLDDFLVSRVELRYIETRRRDEHGNLLKYWSRYWTVDRGAPRFTTDVILTQAP